MTKENAKKLYEHYCKAQEPGYLDSNKNPLPKESLKVMKEAAEQMLKRYPEFGKEAPKKEESKDAKKPKGQ